MPRRLSCSMTIDAVRERRKTVTRRHVDTWKNLKPGDHLVLIEKGMGLPKGAKQRVLAEVEIVDVRVEPIGLITDDVRYGRQEVRLEGLDPMTPDEFVGFWCQGHGAPTPAACWALGLPVKEWTKCRRIEWRYFDEEASDGR